MSNTTIYLAGMAAALMLVSTACDRSESPSASTPPVSADVLAAVNGTPITRAAVLHRIYGSQPQKTDKEPAPELVKRVLDSIILQELTYQEAMQTGLQNDPGYQEDLQKLENDLIDFKRKSLSRLYYRHEADEKTNVTDEESRAYADKHAYILQHEFNVLQIMLRDETMLKQALMDLQQGEDFADVAARPFPKIPETAHKPWKLGYLNWMQIPPPWWETIGRLKAGETSGIIKGHGNRFWMIKLLDTRA